MYVPPIMISVNIIIQKYLLPQFINGCWIKLILIVHVINFSSQSTTIALIFMFRITNALSGIQWIILYIYIYIF